MGLFKSFFVIISCGKFSNTLYRNCIKLALKKGGRGRGGRPTSPPPPPLSRIRLNTTAYTMYVHVYCLKIGRQLKEIMIFTTDYFIC